MGNCIICGTPVDGAICESHQEDVVFEFDGTSPSQLTPGRFYRGTVDGYADFGVFVDVGEHVTGLLHRSELDRRLESLDWEPGDTVYVQVLDVRDNGNVDLGWSIRQSERDFRGKLIDTPESEYEPDSKPAETEPEESGKPESESSETVESEAETPSETEGTASSSDETYTNGGKATLTQTESGDSESIGADESVRPPDEPAQSDDESVQVGDESVQSRDDTVQPGDNGAQSVDAGDQSADEPALNRTTIDALDDQIGAVVRLEGVVTSIRQTSGPTVFELRDETATVECAAFEEAGVRAYPDVDVDDVIRLDGEVEEHYGDLQVETETLEILAGEESEEVRTRLTDALEREAKPGTVELLADTESVASVREDIVDAATTIRRAVMESRPIVVRHSATADGYTAGAAIERAVLPLVREKHTRDDAEYHYFERRPLDGQVYDMDAATGDVTSMLEARDRHGESLPLVVLVDAGGTIESLDGYKLLDLYGADTIVLDDSRGDAAVADSDSVAGAVSPSFTEKGADGPVSHDDVTSTVLAANVAAHVNEDVREDLAHLPAVSFWEDVPEAYEELAAEAGYDPADVSERREAIALESFYQSYKDKRELVIDLLFDDAGELASHISGQFRDKLERELDTARENLTVRGVENITVSILDTDAFTNRFDFPSTTLLVDALHRSERDRGSGPFVTLGLGEDELHVRATEPVDVRELGTAIAEAVPNAGVTVLGGRDGYVEFLAGQRGAVLEAALETLSETLG